MQLWALTVSILCLLTLVIVLCFIFISIIVLGVTLHCFEFIRPSEKRPRWSTQCRSQHNALPQSYKKVNSYHKEKNKLVFQNSLFSPILKLMLLQIIVVWGIVFQTMSIPFFFFSVHCKFYNKKLFLYLIVCQSHDHLSTFRGEMSLI